MHLNSWGAKTNSKPEPEIEKTDLHSSPRIFWYGTHIPTPQKKFKKRAARAQVGISFGIGFLHSLTHHLWHYYHIKT